MLPRISIAYMSIALSAALSVRAAAYIGCITTYPRTSIKVTTWTTNQDCFVSQGHNTSST